VSADRLLPGPPRGQEGFAVLVSFTFASPLRVIGVTLLLLVLPTVTFAQEPAFAEVTAGKQPSRALIVPLYATFAGLQALDAHSTLRALNAGGVESNPLMQWTAGKPAALIAVKSAAAVGTIFLAEKGFKKHPVRTVVLMTALNAAYAGIAVNNYRIANSRR
jgi:hypothetical protein